MNKNIWIGFSFIMSAAGFGSCGRHTIETDYFTVPKQYVNATEGQMVTKEDMLYYQGRPYSGYRYALFTDGDTAITEGWYHGKREGKSMQWYAQGRPMEERWYHDGRKTGTHRGWFANGQQKFVMHLRNDMYQGNVKYWYPNGQVFEDLNYKDGHEEGMERKYAADGSLMANYQSINGRKYGLTGVKGCRSVWADRVP